jgi:putative hemolysin
MHEIVVELGVILALIAANAVFSGAEIAVIALRRSRIGQLVDEGRPGARALRELRDQPERFIATVQVGITVVSATAAAFGGAQLAERLIPGIAAVPALRPWAPELALGLVVAIVSYLSVVLGELVPKSLALRGAERYALLSARPMLLLAWLVRPVVWVLTGSSNLVLRPFGDRTTFSEARLSAEELEQLVEEAGKAGSLDAPTAEIAARALAFRDLTAADVMVPRNRIQALPLDAPPEELKRLLLEEGRSRMPVYRGTLEEIVGYVLTKDLVALVWEQHLVVLADLVRPVHFVPETSRAVHVLREMQRRRTQLAVVVDEHGGVSGLVTLEDLIEELVGEILHEAEEPEDALRREPSGAALVRGDLPVRDANRALGLDLPEGDDYTSVAGLCVSLAGAVPERGTRLTTGDGTELEIVEASPRLVRRVRITPPPRTPAQG